MSREFTLAREADNFEIVGNDDARFAVDPRNDAELSGEVLAHCFAAESKNLRTRVLVLEDDHRVE
jgi:predicted class III extradiol MEMO1 family dioxygenase